VTDSPITEFGDYGELAETVTLEELQSLPNRKGLCTCDRGPKNLLAWNFSDHVLLWILRRNSFLPIRNTCSSIHRMDLRACLKRHLAKAVVHGHHWRDALYCLCC
jgi:hypothetical protein